MSTFTVEAWVKTTSANLMNVVSGGNAGSYISISGGVMRWFDGINWRLGATSINDGKWHQVFYIFDNGAHYFGVDGKWEYQNNAGNGNYTQGSFSTVAVWSNKALRYFNGFIDEVKIYNYARTAAQVAYDYNRGAPIAWYRMDECEGTTIHDASGNNLNGTLTVTGQSVGTCQTASTAWGSGASGKYSGSVYFDGTGDYASVADPGAGSVLDITGDITFSTWWKTPASLGGDRTYAGKFDGSIQPFNFIYKGSTDKMGFYATGGGGAQYCDVAGLQVNTWYQLTWTISGSVVTCYVNGVSKGTATWSSARTANNANLTIGQTNSANWVSGSLDDVQIYNYALSADQVKVLYNGGSVVRYD